jgi:magnesium transporter
MKLYRSRKAPGTAPGTLSTAHTTEPVRMRLIRYDAQRLHEADLLTPAGLDEGEHNFPSCWLDVEGIDPPVISELGARLGIHPLALEDVEHTGQRPKMEEFGDSLFFVVDHFRFDPEGYVLEKQQVSLVLKSDVLLSVQERGGSLFDPVRDRIRGGKPRIRGGGTDYLAYALIDTVVDHVFPVLEDLGDSLEELETELLEQPSEDHLAWLHILKRHLLLLRKSVWPLRDMLNQLLRSENELIQPETRVYLRDVVDHVNLIIDIIETYREMASSLVDLYLSSISNRMNEIMKVLTIIATIFIPLSFVAGLYGMNFDPQVSPLNMPELHWYWGYPFALSVMASMAIGLLAFFRRKKWL